MIELPLIATPNPEMLQGELIELLVLSPAERGTFASTCTDWECTNQSKMMLTGLIGW
ncbi:hypothetical protein CRYUN_Cryun03dG0169900 [Craigia yunnanensis]